MPFDSADVIYDPDRRVKFKTKEEKQPFGCKNESHYQVPLLGLFNREGILGTGVKPTGALCQLQ